MKVSLTASGRGSVVCVVVATIFALVAQNNLMLLICCTLIALWLYSLVVGSINIRHLGVRRVLPADLFAQKDALGAYVVHNAKRWVSGRQIHVSDLREPFSASCDVVGAGDTQKAPCYWQFPYRGEYELNEVLVWSDYPFGWVRYTLVVELPIRLVVFPQPIEGEVEVEVRAFGASNNRNRMGGSGDFLGIREYVVGDDPRRIHWPTSARVGVPVLVERSRDDDPGPVLQIPHCTPEELEVALSAACFEVNAATRRGRPVGIRGRDGGEPLFMPARVGEAWRRQLLACLAVWR